MLRRLAFPLFALLFVGLLAHRVWRSAGPREDGHLPAMPRKAGYGEEQTLYLTPAGAYTAADIEANGRTTPSEKFRGFRARHDVNPRPGDALCPITRTRGNPDCTWVIGGREYRFCCPPCIDEFVRLARERPAELLPPESYVKR